jgi:hypothetical protein
MNVKFVQAVEPAAGLWQPPTNSVQAHWYLQIVTVSVFTICFDFNDPVTCPQDVLRVSEISLYSEVRIKYLYCA